MSCNVFVFAIKPTSQMLPGLQPEPQIIHTWSRLESRIKEETSPENPQLEENPQLPSWAHPRSSDPSQPKDP